MNAPDFTIHTLGRAQVDSPLLFSTVSHDDVADFVPDNASILFNDRVDQIKPGAPAPTMELAGPRKKIYFQPDRVKAAIVTCGGLCPGLNDVIRALVLQLNRGYGVRSVLGIRYGYWGMTPENGHTAIDLTPDMVKNIHFQGGSFLGSSRGPNPIPAMLKFLNDRGVNMLFTIGGDGTQRGALALSEAARREGMPMAIVGIPKTIDNDLAYTERTFGFETACAIGREVLFVAKAEAEGARHGVALVKLMGRHSGFIAGRSALASGCADFVLVPEMPFDLDGPNGLLAAIEKRLREKLSLVVVTAEGAGQHFFDPSGDGKKKDKSGNTILQDIGTYLKDIIGSHLKGLGFTSKVRYIDPSYIIRSAQANANDHVFCTTLAQNAVHAAMSGRTGFVVGRWHGSFVHTPMGTSVSFRKVIDTDGPEWRAIIESTGQPHLLRNP